MSVSATSLDFGTEQNTLAFDISNPSKGELLWEISAEDEWISCSETSGSLKDGTASIIVRIDRSKMGPGTYSGSVVIVSNAGSKSLSVSAKVEGIGLTSEPLSLDFNTITSSLSFIVKNAKGTALSYSITTSNDWISVNKTEGTIMESESFTATVNRKGLASGSYSGVIYIGTKGGAIIIPVAMEIATNQKPTVTVQSASDETYNSAVLHGNLISVGSEKVSSYGFCWSENNNPSISDNVVNLGDCSAPTKFEHKLTGLKVNTKYYVKAYATNVQGTSYSDQIVSFSTTDLPNSPAIATGEVSNIGSNSAVVGGTLSSLGNVESVTHYGHVWSKKQKPTLGSSEYTDFGKATSTLSFSSEMTSLEAATTYYVRAYATNEIGTSYGDEAEFKTQKAEPVLTTLVATSITSSSATCGGRIESSGGHIFSEKGVCWSKNSQPTISDYTSKAGDVTSDTYNCLLSDLQAETNYYYRAYVQSSDGKIFYGDIRYFTTAVKSELPSIFINSIDNITHSSASISATISDYDGQGLKELGVCWSISNPPTINDNVIKVPKSSTFIISLTGLPAATTIYVRAYAINSFGTGYSDIQSFRTEKIVFDIWDGNSATKFEGGSGLASDPIIIKTASQFALLAKNVNNSVSNYSNIYFKLVSNLDLNDITWKPIGGSSCYFSGNFDGGGHIIKGINISNNEYSAGLWGHVKNASISNLELYGSVVSNVDAGALCGRCEESNIFNIHNHCSVNGLQDTGGIVGFFVSAYKSVSISDCSNDNNISGGNTGGIVGNIRNNSDSFKSCGVIVKNCCNYSDIIGTKNTGGIVGYSSKNTSFGSLGVSNCMSYAFNIDGGTSRGGIGGVNNSFDDCYWLFDIAKNIGIDEGKSKGSKFYISETSCITIPAGKDVVELLNQWVETNGSGTCYKWKYETIDGLPCPVFDRLK